MDKLSGERTLPLASFLKGSHVSKKSMHSLGAIFFLSEETLFGRFMASREANGKSGNGRELSDLQEGVFHDN